MSDIKNLHRAYAAVYDSEIKENLKQSRDEISAMSLTQMNDVDLYEVAEEVLEEVFAKNSDIVEAEKLIEAVFRKASEGVESEGRADKIERLGEAFVSAFARVKEKSIRTAVESYSDYRRGKEIIAKRNDDPNNDLSRVRLHNALVAEDRKVVKSGLLSMIESYGNPAAKEEKLRKDDRLFGSPNKKKKVKEAYTVTAADKKANTPAYQGYKAGKKNVKTGEPLYKAADHLKKEELEAVFSEAEIKNILWTDFIEGYQRDPEKGEAEERKKKRERKGGYDEKRERRMNDPKTGINSPAFAEFMRSRGM